MLKCALLHLNSDRFALAAARFKRAQGKVDARLSWYIVLCYMTVGSTDG
jgi:hypothetical protein